MRAVGFDCAAGGRLPAAAAEIAGVGFIAFSGFVLRGGPSASPKPSRHDDPARMASLKCLGFLALFCSVASL
jgi:hypothetical protein